MSHPLQSNGPGKHPWPPEKAKAIDVWCWQNPSWSSLIPFCREPCTTSGSFTHQLTEPQQNPSADRRWVYEYTHTGGESFPGVPFSILNWIPCFVKDKIEPAQKAFKVWQTKGERLSIQTKTLVKIQCFRVSESYRTEQSNFGWKCTKETGCQRWRWDLSSKINSNFERTFRLFPWPTSLLTIFHLVSR